MSRISRIFPDRYADTGFAVKGTPLVERLLMSFDMMATAREMVWSGMDTQETAEERRSRFFQRFLGVNCRIPRLDAAPGSERCSARDER